MMDFKLFKSLIVAVLLLALPLSPAALLAQTKVKPGFNVFSIEQDIEMGREASKEVEQQMPILDDPVTASYISSLGKSLASKSDRPDLPWQFKVINSSDINAFALPGGFIYLNRGLIEAAENEAQLVGVLSHEISHVTLRHGTNQVSKALMIQMPLSILGGALGSGGWQGALARLGISTGLALTLSKFSRTDETQADIVGTQLMTRASYDPHQLTGMFQTLKNLRGREPGKLEQWFASHPDPTDRIERINKEISLLSVPRSPVVNTQKFTEIKSRVKAMPPAPKSTRQSGGGPSSTSKPPRPSSSFREYRHQRGWYKISYPDNWRVSGEGGSGVLFSPQRGVVDYNGQAQIRYGAMVNLFDPHEGDRRSRNLTLQQATDRLLDYLYHGNPHLREVRGTRHPTRLAGAEAIAMTLEGTPPPGTPETVRLIARWYDGNLLYLIFVTPTSDVAEYRDTFRRMARTLVAYHVD